VRDLIELVPDTEPSANNGDEKAGVRVHGTGSTVIPEAYEHAVALWGYLCLQYPGDTYPQAR
jgi:hypothetical protein